MALSQGKCRELFALGEIKSNADTKNIHVRHRRPKAPKMPACKRGNSAVYAISRDQSRNVKIGRSIKPYKRLKDLQVCSPEGLFMLGFLEVSSADAVRLEQMAHRALESRCIGGEWFDLDPKYAVDLLQYYADSEEMRIMQRVGGGCFGETDTRHIAGFDFGANK